ncbi:tubulin-specific chaperone cofactor e-like protein [Plakobranchus ocellatus]|uniref:Tubulin-specific chaperone cofactor e-like protein n=1 Tax=Plakobranchus ocellatus TaxID=259542 RepID=A0AAV4D3E2_9GAST|nr:tubulin-specific chaperone cofactor e-like protein [Plakobranchus ocellatus]
MDSRKPRSSNKKFKKRTKSFTEALKEKYCMDDEPTFDFIIVSPKRKSSASDAELAHLRTVVLNEMDVTRAEIPRDGLTSLCPNVVDLDLANNLLENWHELLAILGHLPRVKYVNVSGNKLRLPSNAVLPDTRLTVENLALNSTGSSLEEVVRLSHVMPALKELHLCGNGGLNNNIITNWLEVWKLRNLPQLKYLILSGNPIKDIFYRRHDASGNSQDTTKSWPEPESDDSTDADSDIMDTGVDLNSWDNNSRLLGHEDNDVNDEEEEQEQEDDIEADCFTSGDAPSYGQTDNGNDGTDRPVSRFGFHKDTVDYSDEGSDAEQDTALTSQPLPQVKTAVGAKEHSGNINIPQAASTSKKKVHNTNFNNSRNSWPARGSPFDDSSSGSSNLTPMDFGWPGFLGFPDPAGMAGLTGLGADSDAEGEEEEEDNPGDWPRLAAEQFLYDLIDQLDLGETTATSSSATSSPFVVTASTALSSHSGSSSVLSSGISTTAASQSLSSWYNLPAPSLAQATESSSASNLRSESVISPDGSTDMNQNAAPTVSHTEAHISKMLAAMDDDSFGSDDENVFAKIYSDDDFIPRSVSMLDDPDSSTPPRLPFKLDSLSRSKSKAQRRLFGPASETVPTSSASSHTQSLASCSALSDRVAQSESDSCSDCEAEQHGRTVSLRHELSEMSSSGVRPLDGPNSWLEMNRSFATSVRDSGEGYSITTTKTPGARVVITGLNVDINDAAQPSFCEAEAKDSSQFSTQRPHCAADLVGGPLAGHASCSGIDTQSFEHILDKENTSVLSTSSVCGPHPPFHQLQMLCLSNASVSHWDHLTACTLFPKLHNIRLKVDLFSGFSQLILLDLSERSFTSSLESVLKSPVLPNVTILNGGEVTATEREKAERFFLRYFMDRPEKPDLYHVLVAKHGPPVKLVDIDLSAGYQEWATLTFKCEGAEHFTRRLHLVEPVARLRTLVSQVLGLPKWCFMLHHHACGPSHPECEREIVELRCEALPMSRFDFAEGDEIIIEVRG